MKTAVTILTLALIAAPLAAEPPMRDKITSVLAESDHHPTPPPTAKQLTESKTPPGTSTAKTEATPPVPPASLADPKPEPLPAPLAATPQTEGTVQLPNFPVTAPLIKDKQRIELDLAKSQVAMRQEQAQVKATPVDKVLNRDDFKIEAGPATFAFGLASSSARAAEARYRLNVLDVEQTVFLTSLATDEKDEKELMRLLAKTKAPSLY
jgi:hypothetical protein